MFPEVPLVLTNSQPITHPQTTWPPIFDPCKNIFPPSVPPLYWESDSFCCCCLFVLCFTSTVISTCACHYCMLWTCVQTLSSLLWFKSFFVFTVSLKVSPVTTLIPKAVQIQSQIFPRHISYSPGWLNKEARIHMAKTPVWPTGQLWKTWRRTCILEF